MKSKSTAKQRSHVVQSNGFLLANLEIVKSDMNFK
jgi:hypothetical protein